MHFNVLDTLGALGGGLAGYLVPFLFVLTIVVFFHELGHFLIARMCGVRVLVFSIGFGPEILGFNDRYGTRWKIAAVPLGGYVKFFGDDNAASAPDKGFLPALDHQGSGPEVPGDRLETWDVLDRPGSAQRHLRPAARPHVRGCEGLC